MCLDSFVSFIENGPCLNCGCFSVRPLGLCEFCENKYLRPFLGWRKVLVGSNPLNVYSLLTWPPGQSDVFSKWVLSLKNSSPYKWKNLAQLWLQNSCEKVSLSPTSILIPCPSRKVGRDHALRWTQAMSQATGIAYSQRLRYSAQAVSSQRSSSFYERKKIRFEIIAQESPLETSKKIVFMDDIVTTGATANAAWMALGQPKDFEVWCLVYRNSLSKIQYQNFSIET